MSRNDKLGAAIVVASVAISAVLLGLAYSNEEKVPQKPKIVSVTRSMEVDV